MLVELPKEKYHLVYGAGKTDSFPIIASVIYRKQDGKIFVDNGDAPKVVFVIHKSSLAYLHTEDKDIDYNKLLDHFYGNNDIPQYFHIYNSNDDIRAVAAQRADVNIRIRDRTRLKKASMKMDMANLNMRGFTAASIDKFRMEDLSVFDLEFVNKFWHSWEDITTNGLGWVILDDGKPISIFYTVCVVNNTSEGDIATLPEYRGRGLASIAGTMLLNSFDEKGINMGWDVFDDNISSIKIAEKFGYELDFPYKFLSIFKKQ